MAEQPPRTRALVRIDMEFLRQKDRLTAADYDELRALDREHESLPEDPPPPAPTYAALLATPEPFRAWLARQPADRTFKPRKTCLCPLAEFLKDAGGKGACTVGGSHAETFAAVEPDRAQLPHWASLFVSAVDATGKTDIYVGTCLTLLRQVTAGE